MFYLQKFGLLSAIDRHTLTRDLQTGSDARNSGHLLDDLNLLLATGQPDLVNGHSELRAELDRSGGHASGPTRFEEGFCIKHFTGPVNYHHKDFIGKI